MFIWGGTFILGRLIVQDIAPIDAACWRFIVASICLFILLAYREKICWPNKQQWFWIVILALSGMVLFNIFLFVGLSMVDAGRAGLLSALTPIIGALASVVILKQRLSARVWSGIIISIVGAIILVSDGQPSFILSQGIHLGDSLIISCGVAWVIYTLCIARATQSMTILMANAWASLVGAILLGIMAYWRGELSSPFTLSLGGWTVSLYMGVLATTVGFVWYNNSVRRLGAAITLVFTNLVPVFAVLLGVFLLNETLSTAAMLGGSVVLLGVLLSTLPDNISHYLGKISKNNR